MSELNGWYWVTNGVGYKPMRFVDDIDEDGDAATGYGETPIPIPSVAEFRAIAEAKAKPAPPKPVLTGVRHPYWPELPEMIYRRQAAMIEWAFKPEPKASGWRFTTLYDMDFGCYAFGENDVAWFFSVGCMPHDSDPRTVAHAVAVGRKEITIAEAWGRLATCSEAVRAKFCELTGYVP